MIRFLWQFKFSAIVFLKGVPGFCWQYLKTRSLVPLLCGLPAIVLTAAMAIITLRTGSPESQLALRDHYRELALAAIEQHDLKAAETYFARVLSSNPDAPAETFEFAKQLFQAGDGPDKPTFLISPAVTLTDTVADEPLLSRSLTMMQSLAPRRPGAHSYPPAHTFLMEFWKSRVPRTDVTQMLALQHAVAADSQNPQPAITLAKFLAERGYHQHAIDILKPRHQDNAQVLILIAAQHALLQQPEHTMSNLAKAESLLSDQLAADPQDNGVRLSLAQVQAAQGRLLPSMLLLAEGCRQTAAPELVDGLISRYTLWLSSMKPEQIQRQLQELTLALQYSGTWNPAHAATEPTPLLTSAGQSVLLPGPIVGFHTAMLNGDGAWLVPLLLGTDAAAVEDYATAVTLLREGYEHAPQHPMIANNLAWTLLQQYHKSSEMTNPAPEASDDAVSVNADPDTSKAVSRNTFSSEMATGVSESQKAGADNQNRGPEGITHVPPQLPQEINQSSPNAAVLKLSEAWQLANIAVQADPKNLSYLETRGLIAAETGRWQMAVNDLQTCTDAGFQSGSLLSVLKQARQRNSRSADP